MNRLKGKYILITGASQGLGRQLAIDFAREGAAGIAIVARRADALERVAASIHEAEPKAEVLMITADLSSEGEIERVVATTLNEFSARLDVLVYLLRELEEPWRNRAALGHATLFVI